MAITVGFLALVRTLAEVHRLNAARGPEFRMAEALHYVNGGLLAAAGTWAAVTAFLPRRPRLSVALVAATVVAMLV